MPELPEIDPVEILPRAANYVASNATGTFDVPFALARSDYTGRGTIKDR